MAKVGRIWQTLCSTWLKSANFGRSSAHVDHHKTSKAHATSSSWLATATRTSAAERGRARADQPDLLPSTRPRHPRKSEGGEANPQHARTSRRNPPTGAGDLSFRRPGWRSHAHNIRRLGENDSCTHRKGGAARSRLGAAQSRLSDAHRRPVSRPQGTHKEHPGKSGSRTTCSRPGAGCTPNAHAAQTPSSQRHRASVCTSAAMGWPKGGHRLAAPTRLNRASGHPARLIAAMGPIEALPTHGEPCLPSAGPQRCARNKMCPSGAAAPAPATCGAEASGEE